MRKTRGAARQIPEETTAVKSIGDRTTTNQAGPLVEIPVGQIAPHPDNPRKTFEQLDELAAGIKTVGILNPLSVRRTGPDQYQLIAGERRWRAAKLARLQVVPCRVMDITDEEAYEAMIRENLDRSDLNEIEKALSYKLGIERCGRTQEAFAKLHNVSQEYISNQIRLLALPEFWQQKLISREINPTQARELLAGYVTIEIRAKLEKAWSEDVAEMTAKEFRRWVLDMVRKNSKSMTYCDYAFGDGCRFKPTPKQKIELDIRPVPNTWGSGTEPRAFNVKLYNELQAAAKKRDAQKTAANNSEKTAARSKLAGDASRRQFIQGLWRHRYNWTAERVAIHLGGASMQHLWQTLGILICGDFCSLDTHFRAHLQIESHVEADYVPRIATMPEDFIRGAVCGAITSVVAEPMREEWDRPFNEAWVNHLAGVFGIDLRSLWKPSIEFLALYGDDEFKALAEEWPGRDPMPSDVQACIAQWPAGFVPDALLRATEHGTLVEPVQAEPVATKAKGKRKAVAAS